jgi:hypothetical protein
MKRQALVSGLFLVGVMLVVTPAARAQGSTVEIGTTLMGVTIGTGNDDVKVFGVPSSSFGLLNPAVYASIFLGSWLAVEPQIGLIWASTGGDSMHLLHFAGQFDYFVLGTEKASPYVFGTVGILDVSGESTNPKAAGGGAGYRMRAGDRLTFRVDGRVTHFTEGEGNSVAFAVSIGGLFGHR